MMSDESQNPFTSAHALTNHTNTQHELPEIASRAQLTLQTDAQLDDQTQNYTNGSGAGDDVMAFSAGNSQMTSYNPTTQMVSPDDSPHSTTGRSTGFFSSLGGHNQYATPQQQQAMSPVQNGSNLASPASSDGFRMPRFNSSAACGKTNVDMNDVQEKLGSLKKWSVSTFQCTKQAVFEHMGKSTRTMDIELERKIAHLREQQRKYAQLLAQSRSFTSYLQNMTEMQQKLADTFGALSDTEGDQLKVA